MGNRAEIPIITHNASQKGDQSNEDTLSRFQQKVPMQPGPNCEWYLVKFGDDFAIQYTGNDPEKIFPSDITDEKMAAIIAEFEKQFQSESTTTTTQPTKSQQDWMSPSCITSGTPVSDLLARNAAWADRQEQELPTLIPSLAQDQHPRIMWIGCSDSRIPETTVLDLLPGDLYVHRNLANIVSTDDMSLLADVQYAVEILRVNHIIICGHYGCGGCSAALGHTDLGLIDNWLRHLRDIHSLHSSELDAISDMDERTNRLVELNIHAQVNSTRRIPTVQEAKEERGLKVHGWVYDVKTGRIKALDLDLDAEKEYYSTIKSDDYLIRQ